MRNQLLKAIQDSGSDGYIHKGVKYSVDGDKIIAELASRDCYHIEILEGTDEIPCGGL